MSRTIRWWWIRHAPSDAPGGRLYGRKDVGADLSDVEGIAALAAILPARALWLTSPLRRTRETAEALLASAALPGATTNVEATPEPDFMEQDFGDWEGRTYDEIDPEFWRDPADNRPPGGESFAELTARVASAIDRHGIDRQGQETRHRDIVVVAHAGVVRAALAHALALSPAAALRFAVDPLSLTRLARLRRKGGAGEAWRVDDVNHPFAGFGIDPQNPNA